MSNHAALVHVNLCVRTDLQVRVCARAQILIVVWQDPRMFQRGFLPVLAPRSLAGDRGVDLSVYSQAREGQNRGYDKDEFPAKQLVGAHDQDHLQSHHDGATDFCDQEMLQREFGDQVIQGVLLGQERHDQHDPSAECVGSDNPCQTASEQADTSGIEKLEGPDGQLLPVHERTSNLCKNGTFLESALRLGWSEITRLGGLSVGQVEDESSCAKIFTCNFIQTKNYWSTIMFVI